MSRAKWYWATDDAIEVAVVPPVGNAPIIDPTTPTELEYMQGDSVNLRIDNVGDDADGWSALNLPPGLTITTSEPTYCIISGVVASIPPAERADPVTPNKMLMFNWSNKEKRQ